MKIEIEISEDSLVERVATQIRGAVFDEADHDETPTGRRLSLENKVRKIMADQVREATNVAVQRIVEDQISAAVSACMEEGWQRTDSYGTPTGPKLTLKDRISEILNKATADGHYGARKNLVDAIIEQGVADAFKTTFQPAVDKAKADFKALLDGSLTAKLREALAATLGIAK